MKYSIAFFIAISFILTTGFLEHVFASEITGTITAGNGTNESKIEIFPQTTASIQKKDTPAPLKNQKGINYAAIVFLVAIIGAEVHYLYKDIKKIRV